MACVKTEDYWERPQVYPHGMKVVSWPSSTTIYQTTSCTVDRPAVPFVLYRPIVEPAKHLFIATLTAVLRKLTIGMPHRLDVQLDNSEKNWCP